MVRPTFPLLAKLLASTLALGFCASALGAQPSAAAELPNPLILQRADPYIHRHTDGFYYFIATVPDYDRLELRRASTVAGLATTEPKTIWRKHAAGPLSENIWAPEIHFIDGRWFIYVAAGEVGVRGSIRMYVLENASANPLEGEWIEHGQLKTRWDSFSLDATTFEHRGTRYLVWAQRDPAVQNNSDLYLAKMDSPTSIVQPQVLLSRPEFDWEKVRYAVNEGPAVLIRNGRVFLTYSAAGTGAEYSLGLLTAREDADLLDPKSWTKSPTPVFTTNEANGIFGPGHNSFTVAEDGKTDLLVYHARNYRDIPGNPLRDPNRHTRVQPIAWRADGTPDFGVPARETLPKFGTVKRADLHARDACVWPDPKTQTYTMYFSSRGPNRRAAVSAYTSKNLEDWTGPHYVFERPADWWADRGIWAPEMHAYRGKSYLFLTFDSSHKFPEQWRDWLPRVKRGSQVLVADNPMGPFQPFANRSTLPEDMMTLDGTLFEEDGVPYMVFCHEWVQIKDGTVEMIQLKDDLSGTVGEPKRLFHGSDAPWAQKSPQYGCYVTDGPWFHRTQGGKLLMLWSSGSPTGYAVGIATSESGKLAGPWKQSPAALFAADGGHPMLFRRFDGQLMMALHQPNKPGRERIQFIELDERGDTLALKGK
ncbi:Alpha-N-arabinofuranosidase [Opitutus terrae PB90-1]|uniref:Alpha-N-arabinofuranosidase n=2 Tax=Opitutus terrae TaxID=107709 RepID=B1ZRX2_OPITP|nr:family 43 glycosylhydrolase [Opitutus terrae]ACB74651.1 Alpha-N-arabinofuranosidase [Opitutus terrae PB90-1]